MPLPPLPVDRRTVLAGAAWSVPVIATAIAAPAVAASGGTLDIDFAVAYIQLKRSDTVAGVIAITNTGEAATDRDITIVLTGLAAPTDNTYTTEFGPVLGDGLVDTGDEAHTRVPTVNSAFVATPSTDGESLTLTATDFTILGGTVFVAVFFTWPAQNEFVDGFVIAGSFTIGGPAGDTTGVLSDFGLRTE